MSHLLLIRHGQASFGAADYDRLSETGRRQARLIGQQFADQGLIPDVLVTGSLQRQIHTAELAIDGWPQTPARVTDTAFDEYDADALFIAYLPGVLAADPALAASRAELGRDRRLFQKTFEAVTRAWIADAPRAEEDAGERWPAFRERVAGALARLHDDYPRDARIAVFTSGGPIAVAVAIATAASDAKTLELNWSLYNGSVSALRSTKTDWRLTAFNDISTLRAARDPALVTFR